MNSLKLADEKTIQSIAFPNISTGVYGYPKDKAAKVAVSTVKSYLQQNTSIKQVLFVCFDEESLELYKGILNE
ncbi:hypothetical protein GCM10028895_19540 [Pontibacter rugosus]